MSQNYDVLIAEEEAKVIEIKEQMESVKTKFIDLVNDHVKSWFEKTTKEIITRNPEKTAQLSEEQLRGIKLEVQELILSSDDLVGSSLGKDSLWWHLQENDKSYPTYQHNIPEFINDEIRLIFGKLGIILSRYGLTKIEHEHSYVHSYQEMSDFVYKSGKSYYRYGYSSPDSLSKTLQEYGKLHEKAKTALAAIKKLNLEKKKSQISDLWDSL